jgi:hypothetical protein
LLFAQTPRIPATNQNVPFGFRTAANPPDGRLFVATGISQNTTFIGELEAIPRTAYRGFALTGSTVKNLGTLEGITAEASGINAAGWIVRDSFPPGSSDPHGFVFANDFIQGVRPSFKFIRWKCRQSAHRPVAAIARKTTQTGITCLSPTQVMFSDDVIDLEWKI